MPVILSNRGVRQLPDKDINDIFTQLNKIWNALNDLRVLVAGNYITKEDLDKYKEENERSLNEIKAATKGQVPGWLLVVLPVMTAVISGLAVSVLT